MVTSDISVELISSDACASPATVSGNVITINVTAVVLPEITISGNTTVQVGSSTTISSSILNGGSSPTYQWQDSTSSHPWTDIPGATGSTIDYSPQQTGDGLRAILRSSVTCPDTPESYSNELTFTLESPPVPRVRLYPNPARSILTIENDAQVQWVSADILDDNGRRVTTINNSNNSGDVILDVSRLMSGVYFIRLMDRKGKPEYFKFVKQ